MGWNTVVQVTHVHEQHVTITLQSYKPWSQERQNQNQKQICFPEWEKNTILIPELQFAQHFQIYSVNKYFFL